MPAAAATICYRFAHFELQPNERRLLASGRPVRVGPHAFDVLVALAEQSGHLITKDELLGRVWGKVVVEENTLQTHISTLRKVLGPDSIATVSGHGYRFALRVTPVDAAPIPAPIAAPAPSAAAPASKHNLPYDFTSFIGREKEIADLLALLGSARLLTLTGSGGCGKTRLAIRLARQHVNAYSDGAWLVELSSLTDEALVLQAVADVLRVKVKSGAELTNAIADYLAQRSILLLLDNAEHVLDECARLAESLLRRCPRLVILVTSRERLAITGEWTYRVPSLSVPDAGCRLTPETVAATESARLFVDRTQLHLPNFQVTDNNSAAIASICRRLDGIALALELAAPTLRSLSVDELNRRLDKRFEFLTEGSRTALPRHRTLRSLIDWSYELLRPTEQALLRRLSVFSGGWTLEAAEHVCRDDAFIDSENTVLQLLNSLADKNLVAVESKGTATRYGMLETVRQYARERLREQGEETLAHHRHASYTLALADEAYAANSEATPVWLDRLDQDLDNMRVSLAWSLSAGGDPQSGLRLAGALYWFWAVRHSDEGLSWLSRLLAIVPEAEGDRVYAQALRVGTFLAYQAGNFARAEALAKQALVSCRNAGHANGVNDVLAILGHIERFRCNYSAAIAYYEQCLHSAKQMGDSGAMAVALLSLGGVATDSGDFAAARPWLEQSVAILRDPPDWRVAYSLLSLAELNYAEHDLGSARGQLTEALEIARNNRLQEFIKHVLTWFGIVAYEAADAASAREYLGQALVMFRDDDGTSGMLLVLEQFAVVVRAPQRSLVAARLWGATERKREEEASPMPAHRRPRFDRDVRSVRAALGDDAAFDAAWNEGRAMSLEQAVDYALRLQACGDEAVTK